MSTPLWDVAEAIRCELDHYGFDYSRATVRRDGQHAIWSPIIYGDEWCELRVVDDLIDLVGYDGRRYRHEASARAILRWRATILYINNIARFLLGRWPQ